MGFHSSTLQPNPNRVCHCQADATSVSHERCLGCADKWRSVRPCLAANGGEERAILRFTRARKNTAGRRRWTPG
jgi:hypothetical protein